PGYHPTPLLDLKGLAGELGIDALYYKDESTRFGLGSFKALGGAYAVARLLQSEVATRLGRPVDMAEITSRQHDDLVAKVTVCCATDGNHGRSVAWGAQRLGCACEIFLHETVSAFREEAIAAYGAQTNRCAGNYDDSVRIAQETARSEGWFVVSDTSYPGYREIPKDVMQGYEIMAEEAFDAVSAVPTHIFLQTGVGGMAAAVVAQAVRRWGARRPTIVLCDPDRAACWFESFRAAKPVVVGGDLDTLMAGLACGEISDLAWDILKDHADGALAVPDGMAVEAMVRLARPALGDPAVVAGESATAGLAGLQLVLAHPEMRTELGIGPHAQVMVFGTEGDTDPTVYEALVGCTAAQVLAASGATG
ncbi:MAG: diaminopropionate ammonia-lyase, partial [Pseudomonadota bacterium]